MTASIGPLHFVLVGVVLFCVGAIGAMVRRNALMVIMSIELMLNAANIVWVAYSKEYGHPAGQVYAFLVMAIAAAEAAVGLAIVIGIFRVRQSIHLDDLNALRDET